MTRRAPETAFERDLRQQLRDPGFRDAFTREAQRIATIDRVINEIDETRSRLGMSKADLARAMGSDPAAVRRLLTSSEVNPRLDTVAAMAQAVGLELELRPLRNVKSDMLEPA